MKSIILYIILASLLLLLILGGCKEAPIETTTDSIHAIYYAKWLAQGIRNYTIEQKVDCFCPGFYSYYLVIVRFDTLHNVINMEDGTSIKDLVGNRFRSINQLFELIFQNLDLNQLIVEYDSVYFYPKKIIIYNNDVLDIYLSIENHNFQVISHPIPVDQLYELTFFKSLGLDIPVHNNFLADEIIVKNNTLLKYFIYHDTTLSPPYRRKMVDYLIPTAEWHDSVINLIQFYNFLSFPDYIFSDNCFWPTISVGITFCDRNMREPKKVSAILTCHEES